MMNNDNSISDRGSKSELDKVDFIDALRTHKNPLLHMLPRFFSILDES